MKNFTALLWSTDASPCQSLKNSIGQSCRPPDQHVAYNHQPGNRSRNQIIPANDVSAVHAGVREYARDISGPAGAGFQRALLHSATSLPSRAAATVAIHQHREISLRPAAPASSSRTKPSLRGLATFNARRDGHWLRQDRVLP